MRNYISFDFETIYGVWDTKGLDYCKKNCSISFEAIENINKIHAKYKLPYTVGIVGLLLRNNILPQFWLGREKHKVSFFKIYNSLNHLSKIPKHLLKLLESSKYCEIVSHTYSHNYFTLENELKLRESELIEIKKDIKKKQIKKAIIFPKNIVSAKTTDFFTKRGFVVRRNFQNILYSTTRYNLIIRILRYLDSFITITEFFNFFSSKNSKSLIITGGLFYRPNFNNCFLSYLHYKRIILHFYYCKLTNRSFHLWSHPHNFYPLTKSISNYEKLIKKLSLIGLKTKHFTDK
jgi:hypothetical protein